MLLEAQILAAVKAEKRGMSVPTLVKLQRNVVEKFDAVKVGLRGVKADWSDSFLAYVNEGSQLYEALMLKRFAAHCHAEDKNGMAVACMTRCYNIFMVDIPKVVSPSWAKIYADHKDDLKQLLDTYVRINNHVTYEKIPSNEDMLAGLPTATSLVERKAFTMPDPAEIPEVKVEELVQATAAVNLNVQDKEKANQSDAPPYVQSTSPPAKPSSPPKENKFEKPKASVRDAFRSLLKTEKKDLK
jgi:cytochrome c551/c552